MELGLTESDGLMRLKAIAIDGTAAGILGKLPSFQRDACKLSAPVAIRRNQRMVKAFENRKAIKQMCTFASRTIQSSSVKVGNEIQFHLTTAKSTKRPSMKPIYVETMRQYLEPNTCFCGGSWLRDAEHDEICIKNWQRFEKSDDAVEGLQLLRVTFGIQEENSEIREKASDDSAIEFGELPDRKEVDSDS